MLIEIKGRADLRVITLSLAHGIDITRKCIVVTDDVGYTRVGEAITDTVYRCGSVYAVIVPELLSAASDEIFMDYINRAADKAAELTGEPIENIIVSSCNYSVNVVADVRAEVQIYKTGMKTIESSKYEWITDEVVAKEDDTLRYMLFYDKKLFRSTDCTNVEKVLINEEEAGIIRSMEQSNRFKIIGGGYFNIATDIGIKKCGVMEGTLRDLRK